MTPEGIPVSQEESEAVFSSAADLFSILSTPIRLRLISALCHGEKNVSQLLAEIDTTQPNMSQHLSTLYRAGILGKRREGTQIFYNLKSQRAATLCRAVCNQIATEIDGDASIPVSDRLMPTLRQG
ncbi:ArsR/SmtB family transcription factor [Methylibium petroleiphilum]|uniref:ArsR/SmtB family transcription factor n=1 Tax=Methylibium petroleiphilum TaxID=105560 RepID=UPI001ACC7400|nr:metalloregulator ArsR/SmtB family transcription factor [Methylibium petroleiphilum]MBN9206248.1 winged helix-turn-helix transcriptional regulator [Methylibium petroleiphilum]